jgi:ribosomal protein S18 acetylase RimI-like enzyme
MTQTILALHPPDPQVSIRPVRLSDVYDLQKNCWPERSPDAIYRFISRVRQTALSGRGIGVVVLDEEGAIIGYGQFVMWPRCGEISDLIIAPAYRGQGLGTTLIQYLMRAAREMHANCVDIGAAMSNPGAVALYRRLGFRDSYQNTMNLGNGDEEVLYLRIKFPEPD